jgi:ATP-binding cassette subfamily B protein
MLKNLWKYVSKRRRIQFLLLCFLMTISSLFEVVSIGMLVPFLGALVNPEQVYSHAAMQPLVHWLGILNSRGIVFPLTVIFVFTVIFSNSIRILLLYTMTRFSFMTGADLSISIYRRTLYQNYIVHISRNSSEVINGIITKTNMVINGIIGPILSLISSTIIIIAILVALFAVDASATIVVTLGFSVLYLGVITYTRKQLRENSQIIANQSTQMLKSLQEGLGGIRDVLIDGSQKFYCDLYRNADLPLRIASGNNQFIAGSPRYVIEAVGMILIAGVAYSMSLREDGMNAGIPILGALAFGAQRLLPALQQAYSSYSRLKATHVPFQDVLELLNQPLLKKTLQNNSEILAKRIAFRNEICLSDLNFRYTENDDYVLKNVNLKLTKGMCVGFIGITGSGKSTLIDIIMGLLFPNSGGLFIDGKIITDENRRAWQDRIAHVPQNIYLSDSTIEENIAFGISKEKIDFQRVRSAAKSAQIAGHIEGLTDGYQTFVGEQGVRLSGGQRQRIGIARALYRQADVLILDEATSALDYDTEQAVMKSVEGLKSNLTILIIAHRLTTLKACDQIVKLNKDKTVSIRSYKEIDNE